MTIRLANAPVSWGIFEFAELSQKYAYTEVLDQIAATGYEGIELGPWGYLPTDPEVLRPELERRSLRLLSAYVPCRFADPAAVEAVETQALRVGRLLAAFDAVCVVLADDNAKVPELVAESGRRTGSKLSPPEWDVYAAGVNRVAHRLHDEFGLKTTFHHHCAGYVETAEETRNLMGRTSPDLVGLCLDTGHWHYAGGDALDAVAEYGERIRYLHLKDCDPEVRRRVTAEEKPYFEATRLGVFCEMGQGEVDFPSLISEMNRLGYDGWAVVEQDVLDTDVDGPRQSAQRNRDYLRSLGL